MHKSILQPESPGPQPNALPTKLPLRLFDFFFDRLVDIMELSSLYNSTFVVPWYRAHLILGVTRLDVQVSVPGLLG